MNLMKKKVTPKEPLPDKRKIVMVRNMSEAKWNAAQEKAKREGRAMWAVLEELLDSYLLGKEASSTR